MWFDINIKQFNVVDWGDFGPKYLCMHAHNHAFISNF